MIDTARNAAFFGLTLIDVILGIGALIMGEKYPRARLFLGMLCFILLIPVVLLGAISIIEAPNIPAATNAPTAIRAPGSSILPGILNSTPTALQTQSPTIALSDNFDRSNDSYDPNLWICENDCGIDNLFLKNGELILQRNYKGWTGLSSRSSWSYNSLVSLEGKMKISGMSGSYNAWLAVGDVGCFIFGKNNPYIQCYFGPVNSWAYSTDQKSIDINKWYKIKIDFGQESHKIQYFLDGNPIGEYSLTADQKKVPVYLGTNFENDKINGFTYMDDLILTIGER
jgi:hypothetical protein